MKEFTTGYFKSGSLTGRDITELESLANCVIGDGGYFINVYSTDERIIEFVEGYLAGKGICQEDAE